MIISCQNCGARYKIKDDLVSGAPKRAKCKNCGQEMLIRPEAEETAAAGAAPASKVAPQVSAEVRAVSADLKSGAPGDSGVLEKAPAGTLPAGGEGGNDGSQAQGTQTAPDSPAVNQDKDSIQAKLEQRRKEMEDEISGRLNKAALETLDFDVLAMLATKVKSISENPAYGPETGEQLFTCISCQAIYSLFPDDPRVCANCSGDVALVRGEDIQRQFGMFHR